jgi:hypothetical protein
LLAKDEIKEALMDALGSPETVAESQRLGKAAVLTMLRVARHCPAAVPGQHLVQLRAADRPHSARQARRGALHRCAGGR